MPNIHSSALRGLGTLTYIYTLEVVEYLASGALAARDAVLEGALCWVRGVERLTCDLARWSALIVVSAIRARNVCGIE